MQKQNENYLYNQVYVVGRLCNTPQKCFTKRKQLFTRFLVKSVYDSEVFIPFIMFGQDVDIVCTKFKQGDIVVVDAQIQTRENKNRELMIEFVVNELRLVAQSKIQIPTEDKFKTIVALYDKDVIDKRFRKRRD